MAEAGMVIVGAGKAGARAVVGLREHGWHGPITLIGEETLPPYDRPPLSKASIMEEGEPAPILLLDEETIHPLGATWRGARKGGAVTVSEALPRILLRGVPAEIAGVVAKRHAEAGVDIVTDAKIASIESDAIVLADGRRIPASILIAGIGAAPAIGLGE